MHKVKRYYNTKKATAKQQSIEFTLTLSDIYLLLYMAGITIGQIGKKSENYCLARLGDSGAYERGNCRFITVAENNAEKTPASGYENKWAPDDPRRDRIREYNLSRNRTRDKLGRFID